MNGSDGDLIIGFTDLVRAEIRAELARRRLGIDDLAAMWRIAPRTAAARLSGRGDLSVDDIDRIARALGYDPFDFVARALRNRPPRGGGAAEDGRGITPHQ